MLESAHFGITRSMPWLLMLGYLCHQVTMSHGVDCVWLTGPCLTLGWISTSCQSKAIIFPRCWKFNLMWWQLFNASNLSIFPCFIINWPEYQPLIHWGLLAWLAKNIFWTNARILLIRPLGTNFSENQLKKQNFSFMKMHLKMSPAKWQPSCPRGDELSN